MPRVEIIVDREAGEWKWTVILDGSEAGTGMVHCYGGKISAGFNTALQRAGGYALVLMTEREKIKEAPPRDPKEG